MLDLKYLRTNFDEVKQKLANRGDDISGLDQFADLDKRRLELINETEELKNNRNTVSKEVAEFKKNKQDAGHLITEMREVGETIKALDEDLRQVEGTLQEILMTLPNIHHISVPIGETEEDNALVDIWGQLPAFDFEPKSHWDIVTDLDIVDFERAAKVTGSRFVFYKGLGARLERALINFMMDLHEDKHGYTGIIPPYLVNRDSMTGTGQLPKFEQDAFKIREEDYFLIPTAEVPVTNLHRDEILDREKLPITYSAYSACFRSEAGSAGRDTRGLIRHHQFNKVELVRFVEPEESYNELEIITRHCEKVLQLLNLPYRIVNLCTGDLGFSSAKTYDIEVWLPSYGTYKEISSCSNFEDFQARRAGIRFRREPKGKPEFVHTLNGSGLAIERTVAAIIENYQQKDGSVVIPKELRSYMGNKEKIAK